MKQRARRRLVSRSIERRPAPNSPFLRIGRLRVNLNDCRIGRIESLSFFTSRYQP